MSDDEFLVEKLREILLRLYPPTTSAPLKILFKSQNEFRTELNLTIIEKVVLQNKFEGKSGDVLSQSLSDFIRVLKMSLMSSVGDEILGKKVESNERSLVTLESDSIKFNLSESEIENLNDLMMMSEESSSFPFKNILIILSYSLIASLAIFGNLLVFQLVIRSRRLHTLTHVLLANLAVADFFLATLNIPFSAARVILTEWPFGSFLCQAVPFVQVISVYVISFTMAVIALDRYQVIMNPLSRRMKSSEGIPLVIAIWIFSAILSLPYFLKHKIVTVFTLGVVKRCKADFDPVARQFLTVGTFLAQYLIPLALTTLSYVLIMRRLGNRSSELGSTTPRQAEERSRAKCKTIKMLLLTVIFFSISWAPINLYHLLTHFNLIRHDTTTLLISHVIAMSSSCYNPFIYCWLNTHFRREAYNWLHCFRRKRSPIVHPGIEINGIIIRSDLVRQNNLQNNTLSGSFHSSLRLHNRRNVQTSGERSSYCPEQLFITSSSSPQITNNLQEENDGVELSEKLSLRGNSHKNMIGKLRHCNNYNLSISESDWAEVDEIENKTSIV